MTNSKGYLRSLLTGDSGDWQKIVWNPNSKFSPTKYQLQGLGQVTRSLQLHFSSVKWHPPCRAEWGGTKAEKQEHGAWFLFLDEKERKKERKTTIAVLLITGPSDSDDSEMKSSRPVWNRLCFPLKCKRDQSQKSLHTYGQWETPWVKLVED